MSATVRNEETGRFTETNIEHGTRRGYMKEWRRGIPRCPECLRANREYLYARRDR